MIRTGIIWTSIVFLAVCAMSLYAQLTLPMDAELAVHWGPSGEADGFASKLFALWFMPGLILVIGAIFVAIPFIEPRKGHLLQSSALYVTIWIGVLLVEGAAHSFIVLTALGFDLPVAQGIMAMVGLLLAVIGNLLGKSQSNFFMGIRTPWTLSSNEAWDKTHRLAGRLWVVGGLAIAVLSFLVPLELAVYVVIGIAGVITVIPLAASYVFWRDADDKQTGET